MGPSTAPCRRNTTQEGGLPSRTGALGRPNAPLGGAPSPTARSRRARDQTNHGASYDELFTELVHSAEATRPWHGWCAPPRPITNTPGPNTKSMPDLTNPSNTTCRTTGRTTTESPRPRPPDVPRPSVLADAHDLFDDLDWLAPWTRRSPRACGSGRAGTPHCTGRCRKTQESGLRVPFARQTQRPAGGRTQPDCAQQARPRDQTDHGASYDELFTELVHSAEATRPWHG